MLRGLRSTAVVIRRKAGHNVQQVSYDMCMSVPTAARYSRFMDQREAAESNILLLEASANPRARRG